jgi:uncharacterized protein (DUF488 family)
VNKSIKTGKKTQQAKTVLYTIGHSTHPIDGFIDILKTYEVALLVDVRTIPKSRHNPQFNGEDLAKSLRKAGIGYLHTKGLGGLRHAREDSPNTAWRNASFRGFADYMQTEDFAKALDELIETAREQTTVIMCAEAVPWRCHRSLIGDALIVRGIDVRDVFSSTECRSHVLTSWAAVKGGHVLYPGE